MYKVTWKDYCKPSWEPESNENVPKTVCRYKVNVKPRCKCVCDVVKGHSCHLLYKWKESEMTRRYPIVSTNVDIEDPSTLSKHQSAIAEELDKAKPRDTVLLPLLKSTYGERRLYIVNNSSSVKDIKTQLRMLKPEVYRGLSVRDYGTSRPTAQRSHTKTRPLDCEWSQNGRVCIHTLYLTSCLYLAR